MNSQSIITYNKYDFPHKYILGDINYNDTKIPLELLDRIFTEVARYEPSQFLELALVCKDWYVCSRGNSAFSTFLLNRFFGEKSSDNNSQMRLHNQFHLHNKYMDIHSTVLLSVLIKVNHYRKPHFFDKLGNLLLTGNTSKIFLNYLNSSNDKVVGTSCFSLNMRNRYFDPQFSGNNKIVSITGRSINIHNTSTKELVVTKLERNTSCVLQFNCSDTLISIIVRKTSGSIEPHFYSSEDGKKVEFANPQKKPGRGISCHTAKVFLNKSGGFLCQEMIRKKNRKLIGFETHSFSYNPDKHVLTLTKNIKFDVTANKMENPKYSPVFDTRNYSVDGLEPYKWFSTSSGPIVIIPMEDNFVNIVRFLNNGTTETSKLCYSSNPDFAQMGSLAVSNTDLFYFIAPKSYHPTERRGDSRVGNDNRILGEQAQLRAFNFYDKSDRIIYELNKITRENFSSLQMKLYSNSRLIFRTNDHPDLYDGLPPETLKIFDCIWDRMSSYNSWTENEDVANWTPLLEKVWPLPDEEGYATTCSEGIRINVLKPVENQARKRREPSTGPHDQDRIRKRPKLA